MSGFPVTAVSAFQQTCSSCVEQVRNDQVMLDPFSNESQVDTDALFIVDLRGIRERRFRIGDLDAITCCYFLSFPGRFFAACG